jgi:hypothetical protein
MGFVTTLTETDVVCEGCKKPFSEFLRAGEAPSDLCADCESDIGQMNWALYEEALCDGEPWAEEAYAFNHPETE